VTAGIEENVVVMIFDQDNEWFQVGTALPSMHLYCVLYCPNKLAGIENNAHTAYFKGVDHLVE
jgi:hypothetical protein